MRMIEPRSEQSDRPIWEEFITPRDLELISRVRVNPVGFGKSPALLMVDLYRAVFGDRRQPLLDALDAWPSSCGTAGWDALPHLQRLLTTARAAGIPVVHVTGLPAMKSWRATRLALPRMSSPDERAAMYEIMPEVAPVGDEVVLRKAAPSAFFGTPLHGHLNELGVDSLIVAGEATGGCVRATVVDACSYRYKVAVVEECVFDNFEASHAVSLFEMSQKYADVVTVEKVVKFLESREV